MFIELGYLGGWRGQLCQGVTFGYEGSYFWGDMGDKILSDTDWDVVFGGCNEGLTEGFLVCGTGDGGAGGGREENIFSVSSVKPVQSGN